METTKLSVADEVFNFILSSPTLEQIISFRPSDDLQAYISHLLERNREGRLSDAETLELDDAQHLNQFVSRLKAYARIKLKASEKPGI